MSAIQTIRTKGRQHRKPKRRDPSAVVVSYRCPVCGGPHPRAEHPK